MTLTDKELDTLLAKELEELGIKSGEELKATIASFPEVEMSDKEVDKLYIIYQGYKTSKIIRAYLDLCMTAFARAEVSDKMSEFALDMTKLYLKYAGKSEG